MRRAGPDDLLAFVAACSPRPVTPEMAAAACDMTRAAAQQALSALVRRGLAERMARGRYRATKSGIELVRDGRQIGRAPLPPRARGVRGNSLHARLWAALRKLRKATAPELVQIAGRGTERNAIGNARDYLRALVRAGYVAEMKQRAPGVAPSSRGFKRYLLVRDPGPAAPGVYKRHLLRDPNSGKLIDLTTGEPAS